MALKTPSLKAQANRYLSLTFPIPRFNITFIIDNLYYFSYYPLLNYTLTSVSTL